MLKPTVIASHSHNRRKVQLQRQWDGTEANSPITPSPPSYTGHKTHTDDMECIDHSYWRENYCPSDHHHPVVFSSNFSLWKFWGDSDSCRVSVGVVVTVWVKISGKFSSLTMRPLALSARLTNTSSNLLLPSKPTWKLEQKLTFFSVSPTCTFSPKCTSSYLTQISNCLIGSLLMNRQKITCF